MLRVYKTTNWWHMLTVDFFFSSQKPKSLKPGMKFQRFSPCEKLQDQRSGELYS